MLGALLAACAPDPPVGLPAGPTAATTAPVSSTGGEATAAPPPAPTGTARAPGGLPGAELQAHGVVTCPVQEAPAPRLVPWDALDGLEPEPDPETGLYGPGVVVEDLDGDGHLDLFLPGIGDDHLLLSTGPGAWVPADDRLPPDPGRALGAVGVDWEGDGDVDLLLLHGGQPDALLLNDGTGRFEAAGEEVLGPVLATPDAGVSGAWADVDGDGDLDLLVAAHTLRQPWFSDAPSWMAEGGLEDYANDVDELPPPDPNLLLLQQDGALVDATATLPPAAVDTFSFAATLVDLDGDGDPDVHVASDFGHEVAPDAAARNDGGTWTDVGQATGLAIEVFGMGTAVGDLGDDGLPDLLVPSILGVRMLESQPDGTWADTTSLRGLSGLAAPDPGQLPVERWFWGGDLGDYDADGDLDLVLGVGPLAWELLEGVSVLEEGQEDLVGVMGPDGTWDVDAEPLPGLASTRGTLWVDLDEDGFLDLVRASWTAPLRLDRNTCDGHAWLEVDLRQPGPNPRAIGARVQVVAGDRTHTRWVMAGGRAMASSGPARVHFGLGDAASVDVVVRWPDGREDRFPGVTPRQRVTVVRTDPPGR